MTSPTDTLTLLTVPSTSARTGISIFIDSSSTTMSPLPIWSPSLTTTSSTLATISARTSSAIFTPLVSAICACWLLVYQAHVYRTIGRVGTAARGPLTAHRASRERLWDNLTGARRRFEKQSTEVLKDGQAWP